MKQFLKLLSIIALAAITAGTHATAEQDYKNAAMHVAQRIKNAIETSPYVDKIHMQYREPIKWEDLATYPYLQGTLPKQGMLLDYSYGSPEKILTPVGVVKLNVDNALEGNSQEVNARLLAIMHQVGASGVAMILFKDVVRNMWGEAGPFYAITSINGVAIPAVIV